MGRWVRSTRYANRMVRVGRLMVVFRGERAEVPDWAEREYRWMLARMPGVPAAEPPQASPPPAADIAIASPPQPTAEDAVASAASDEPPAPTPELESPEPAARGRAGRRGR